MSEAAYAAALSGLPGMGPASLVAILDEHAPQAAWRAVLAGDIERPRGRAPGDGGTPLPWPDQRPPSARPSRPGRTKVSWAEAAARVDPLCWWEPFERSGVRVTWRGRPDYPAVLVSDPDPPGVLFWRGDLRWLERPCVAIVGTRNATPEGRRIAFEMGRDLAAAGVCVVSGLALGIDGAAHAGVLHALALPAESPSPNRREREGVGPSPPSSVSSEAGAGPVGIAASGVDVPYPRRHARLWERVAETGAVVTENLPGRPAQAWRFPSRNRIIAAVSRLVVVVESHSCGGSLITAEAAIQRGIDVRAVPGPVHSPASAGSNQLLYDGPGPVRHAQDVLDAIGVFRSPSAGHLTAGPRSGSGETGRGGSLDPLHHKVLSELGWTPVTVGRVMARTGLDPATAERVLDELQVLGLARRESGWWYRAG